jgi:uncharacterized protein YecE (DUF72 family)
MSVKIHVGTSGFYYEHWRGVFYPQDLPKSEWLAYYVRRFDTLELNSTFYHLPKAKSVERWRSAAKEGFCYSLKAHRSITHYKRLVDVKDELYRFLHLIKPLKGHLGAVLFQLPPSLHYDKALLQDFLQILPKGYRYAVEFRHKSWYEEAVLELLHRFGVALCVHDFGKRETPLVATADFSYIRFHGPDGHYGGSYEDAVLQEWAKRITSLLAKGEIFCYFNNDYEGNAVKDAMRLRGFLQQQQEDGEIFVFGDGEDNLI